MKQKKLVAPLVGAWIEISSWFVTADAVLVAPLVGAWIEIPDPLPAQERQSSLPLWERGLK